MPCDKNHQKSAQVAYSNASQPYVATGTPLAILGAQETDCGCSVKTQPGGMQICTGGLYCLEADVTSTPTAAGTQVVQLYRDGVAIPSAVSTITAVAAAIVTQHVGTVLRVGVCCAGCPVFTVRISGVAGTVSHVKMAAVRLA